MGAVQEAFREHCRLKAKDKWLTRSRSTPPGGLWEQLRSILPGSRWERKGGAVLWLLEQFLQALRRR